MGKRHISCTKYMTEAYEIFVGTSGEARMYMQHVGE